MQFLCNKYLRIILYVILHIQEFLQILDGNIQRECCSISAFMVYDHIKEGDTLHWLIYINIITSW